MKIRLLKLGHAAKEVEVPAGATVEEAIRASLMETNGYSITCNGTGAMLSSPVHEGDVIALVPKVEGGRFGVQGHYLPGACQRMFADGDMILAAGNDDIEGMSARN